MSDLTVTQCIRFIEGIVVPSDWMGKQVPDWSCSARGVFRRYCAMKFVILNTDYPEFLR